MNTSAPPAQGLKRLPAPAASPPGAASARAAPSFVRLEPGLVGAMVRAPCKGIVLGSLVRSRMWELYRDNMGSFSKGYEVVHK